MRKPGRIRTNTQLETFVHEMLEIVENGGRVENATTELKRQWPDALKTARRLAGQANAARGEQIIWIVGIDEETGEYAEPSKADLADTWKEVQAKFDATAPELVTDLVVVRDAGTVHALLFDTSRPPYVVVDQDRSEILWRDGTRIRPAKRHELLRLLTAQASIPEVDLITAEVVVADFQSTPPNMNLVVRLCAYITPTSRERLVFPEHRVMCTITANRVNDYWSYACGCRITAGAPDSSRHGYVVWTGSELIVDGPGRVTVVGQAMVPDLGALRGRELRVSLFMPEALTDYAIQLNVRFPWHEGMSKWIWLGNSE